MSSASFLISCTLFLISRDSPLVSFASFLINCASFQKIATPQPWSATPHLCQLLIIPKLILCRCSPQSYARRLHFLTRTKLASSSTVCQLTVSSSLRLSLSRWVRQVLHFFTTRCRYSEHSWLASQSYSSYLIEISGLVRRFYRI